MVKRNTICFRGKKGAVPDTIVLDIIIVLIVAVIFSMVVFFGWQMFTELKTDVRADLSSNESQQVIDDVEARYPSVFDALFVLIFLGMWAAGFIASLMSDQHPVIFGFMMLLMVFVLIIAAIFGNYYEETFQDADVSTVAQSFPMTNWIMTHLLLVTIGMVVTIMLGLMGKNRVL